MGSRYAPSDGDVGLERPFYTLGYRRRVFVHLSRECHMVNIHLEDSEDVRFSYVEADFTFENSQGVVDNSVVNQLHATDDSDVQVINSELGEVVVDESYVELHETYARKIIEVSSGAEDPISENLRYHSEKILDTTDPYEKVYHIDSLRAKLRAAEPYLKYISYGETLRSIIEVLL
jgi:hypothetical protein